MTLSIMKYDLLFSREEIVFQCNTIVVFYCISLWIFIISYPLDLFNEIINTHNFIYYELLYV